MLDHLREGVMICAPDLRILEANAPACRFLGRSRDEVLGRVITDPSWALVRLDQSPLSPGDHPASGVVATGRPVGDIPLGAPREGPDSRVWGLVSAYPETTPDGDLARVVVTIIEVGQSATGAAGIFDSGRGLAAVFRSSPVGIVASRASDQEYVDANQTFLSMFGYARDEAIGHTAVELGTWADAEDRLRIGEQLSTGAKIIGAELRYRTRAGDIRWALASMEVVELEGELCVLSFLNDITDRKRAEEALRKSEERYRLLSDNAGDVVWLLNTATQRFEYVSPSVERLRGFTVEEVLDQSLAQAMTPESFRVVVGGLPGRLEAFASGDESARTQTHTIEQTRKDGSIVPTEVVTTLVTDGEGTITHIQGVSRDITERKRVEEELRFRETLLEETGRLAHVGGWWFDVATGEGDWTDEVARIHDLAPGEATSRDIGLRFYVGESRAKMQQAVNDAVDHGVPYDLEVEMVTAGGVHKWVHTIGNPVVDDRGRVVSVTGSFQDISERKLAEAALRSSEMRFRELVDAAPEGIFVQRDGRYRYVNPAMARLLGSEKPVELLGASVFDRVPPAFHEMLRERVQVPLQTVSATSPIEHELLRLDDSTIPVESVAVRVVFEGVDSHLVFVRDLTAQRQAEAERSSLEAQLRQSQKLESIGRLAGGVAHDFNNILMVQKGYCELLKGTLRANDPLAVSLTEIETCTERATALTRQLLAFSRKQTLDPKVIDVGRLIGHLEDMLRRLVGEDVDFGILMPDEPAMVKADPGQIEQVLVNLAVNARDAMPDGGRLTIEVSAREVDAHHASGHVDLSPGQYVVVAVSDTGLGMDESTMAQIFEPFFTTKAEGKGTGLGLSTVYGIVNQSGGSILVFSEPGLGTTFKVYLPEAQGEAVPVGPKEASIEKGRGQLIVLVEDEPALRQLGVAMLDRLGYQGIAAENGGAALMLIEEQGVRPALVVTDVIMPGMNGRVLVERLRKTLPDLRVIYMSGYTGDTIARDGVIETDVAFLQKPFSLASLSEKIKAALAGA